MAAQQHQRDEGFERQCRSGTALHEPLTPASPLYAHVQRVVEEQYRLQQQLLVDAPPPPVRPSSSSPAPIAGPEFPALVDLSRLDVRLQALILRMSQYSIAHPTGRDAQESCSLQVAAEQHEVGVGRSNARGRAQTGRR